MTSAPRCSGSGSEVSSADRYKVRAPCPECGRAILVTESRKLRSHAKGDPAMKASDQLLRKIRDIGIKIPAGATFRPTNAGRWASRDNRSVRWRWRVVGADTSKVIIASTFSVRDLLAAEAITARPSEMGIIHIYPHDNHDTQSPDSG